MTFVQLFFLSIRSVQKCVDSLKPVKMNFPPPPSTILQWSLFGTSHHVTRVFHSLSSDNIKQFSLFSHYLKHLILSPVLSCTKPVLASDNLQCKVRLDVCWKNNRRKFVERRSALIGYSSIFFEFDGIPAAFSALLKGDELRSFFRRKANAIVIHVAETCSRF
jgi:hypothetical protein